MMFVDMESRAFPLAVNSESLVLHLFPEHVSSKPVLGTYWDPKTFSLIIEHIAIMPRIIWAIGN